MCVCVNACMQLCAIELKWRMVQYIFLIECYSKVLIPMQTRQKSKSKTIMNLVKNTTHLCLSVYLSVRPSVRSSVSVLSIVHCLIGIHSHTTFLPSHTLFLLSNQPVKDINFGQATELSLRFLCMCLVVLRSQLFSVSHLSFGPNLPAFLLASVGQGFSLL